MSARRPVVLVTGATAGIGRGAAIELARRGADIVVHGRDPRRVQAARAAIARAAPAARTHGVVADLADRAAIRRMAATVEATLPRLDVLVHNAAVVPRAREVTADGIEMQLAVNHLAPVLLTHLLRPLLVRSAPARVVVVASQLEANGVLDFDDLQSARGYDHNRAYAATKLANVLFAAELARRLEGTGVTSNSLHPGVAGTNLLNALFGKPRWQAALTRIRHAPPTVALATLVKVALDPGLAGVTGAYFTDERPAEPSAAARDPALARRLWAASAALLGLADEAAAAAPP